MMVCRDSGLGAKNGLGIFMSSFDRHLWVASIVASHFAYLPRCQIRNQIRAGARIRSGKKITAIENAFCFGPSRFGKPVCALLPCNKKRSILRGGSGRDPSVGLPFIFHFDEFMARSATLSGETERKIVSSPTN